MESANADPMPVSVMDAEAPVAIEPVVARPGPVTASERVTSVDVLRGVALLGILMMNIVFFSWPEEAYSNPSRGGGDTGVNLFIWMFNHLIFDQKMMTIFSMLFGGGLILMGERFEASGRSLAGIYYRRVAWLLVIGALHAYLLWSGDILFMYAECGLVLYPLRRLWPRTLIILGSLMLLAPIGIGAAVVGGAHFIEVTAHKAQEAKEAGEEVKKFDAWMEELWTTWLSAKLSPTPEKIAENTQKEIDIYRDGYRGIRKRCAGELIGTHTVGFIFFILWDVGGRMLIGMGFMKLGVFSAARSRRFYSWMMAIGYGIGLPMVAYDTYALLAHEFQFSHMVWSMVFFNHVGSISVALGHVGLIMTVCQLGILTWLTARLAAVGRMALSNYLTHSIVCTTLFYGYGFALFGRLDRIWLVAIVLTIWVFQLLISPIWLSHYRFGPAEWVWRSLTYWRLQPMRREVPVQMHV